MDPNDPRSRHVWDFLGIVAQLRPRAFVMENVKALAANSRWSRLLLALRREAWRQGYPNQVLLLNGADYGVPQLRERMFLVGIRDETAVGVVPSDRVLAQAQVLETPLPTTAKARPTVRQVLSALPPVGNPGNDSVCSAKVTPARTPVLRRSPYAGMLFNGQGRPLELDRPALTLPASMGGNRTPIIDQEELEHGAQGWVIGYHARLWAGQPPVRSVPKRLRRITVEEAAALQTFPRGMRFAGTQSAQYRQIGNAVPPELAYHVAVAVRSTLAEGRAAARRLELLDDAQLALTLT
jgi:DNA (cytosine-5)-methyltransferase 1